DDHTSRATARPLENTCSRSCHSSPPGLQQSVDLSVPEDPLTSPIFLPAPTACKSLGTSRDATREHLSTLPEDTLDCLAPRVPRTYFARPKAARKSSCPCAPARLVAP